MTDFNEVTATREYLVEQLIVARQKNEVLTETNRRLERLLIKYIKDLQDASQLMDELSNAADQLSNATDQLVAKVIKQ